MAEEEASHPKVLIFTAPILCFECEEKAPNLPRKGEFLIGTGKKVSPRKNGFLSMAPTSSGRRRENFTLK